jgi:hypothetical protein
MACYGLDGWQHSSSTSRMSRKFPAEPAAAAIPLAMAAMRLDDGDGADQPSKPAARPIQSDSALRQFRLHEGFRAESARPPTESLPE